MTTTFRVTDSDNPGYLAMVDELDTSRFFFICKGRVRAASYSTLFYQAWEQMSPRVFEAGTDRLISPDEMTTKLTGIPADPGDPDDPDDDVEAVAPWVFDFQHDCQGVMYGEGYKDGEWKSHMCEVAKDDEGNVIPLPHLTVFIPDKRFKAKNSKDGYDYHQVGTATSVTSGSPKYSPKMLLYLAELTATAIPSSTVGYWDITLTWNTQFSKDKIGADVEEQFFVYAIDPSTGDLIQLDEFIDSDENYELKRVDKNVVTEIGLVAPVEAGSHEMTVTGLDSEGQLAEDMGTINAEDSIFTPVFNESYDDLNLTNPKYVPVITTAIRDLSNTVVQNTYGCDIKSPGEPMAMMAAASVDVSTKVAERDAEGNVYRAYRASVTLTPVIPHGLDGVYMWRVWRVNDDGSETLLNEETPPSVVTTGDILVTALQATYPGENALTFSDYIIHKELQDGESFTVNYIARMYAYKTTPTGSTPAPRPQR